MSGRGKDPRIHHRPIRFSPRSSPLSPVINTETKNREGEAEKSLFVRHARSASILVQRELTIERRKERRIKHGQWYVTARIVLIKDGGDERREAPVAKTFRRFEGFQS